MDQLAYIKNTRKKVDLKAAMLSAQERYLKVKNNPNRYEDEDDYRAALDRAKAQYIDAKNKYEDNDGDKTFKQKVKDLQQKLIKLFSKETDLNSKKLLSHCYYLQKLNQKIYSLKNKLAQLENLDKEDILDTFGNLNGQLKELQKRCDELTEQITELQSNKRAYESEKEQLLRRLAELDNLIAGTDSMIEKNNKSLEEVQQKIVNSNNNLSSAIYNCYKKQEELLNQLDTIQTEIKKVSADLEGIDYKEKESKIEFNDKLKDILTFTNDIEEFSDKSPDDAYNVIANND